MVLSAEGVRKRFLFPSEVWDVRLNPEKNCPNRRYGNALIGVFAIKGAELFWGVQRGIPSGQSSCPRLLLNRKKSSKIRNKSSKNGSLLMVQQSTTLKSAEMPKIR